MFLYALGFSIADKSVTIFSPTRAPETPPHSKPAFHKSLVGGAQMAHLVGKDIQGQSGGRFCSKYKGHRVYKPICSCIDEKSHSLHLCVFYITVMGFWTF